MSQTNLMVNSAVNADFSEMEKDITDIESILQKAYAEMLKLDDTVWKAKEKERIDQTFMPYLEKFATLYPNYLRARVQFAKSAVEAHQELDLERSSLSDI